MKINDSDAAEFKALAKRLDAAGRVPNPEMDEFTALENRLKKFGYQAEKEPDETEEPEETKAEEKEEPKESEQILAALKSTSEQIKALLAQSENSKSAKPKKWKFSHRYDVYNKLVETTAEAEG